MHVPSVNATVHKLLMIFVLGVNASKGDQLNASFIFSDQNTSYGPYHTLELFMKNFITRVFVVLHQLSKTNNSQLAL
jgi:hypothetical protein